MINFNRLFITSLLALQLSMNAAVEAQTTNKEEPQAASYTIGNLRHTYSKPQSQWPKILTADSHQASVLGPLTMLEKAPADEQVELGKALFFDPLLSKNKTVSCASCHEPRLLFGDRRRVAIGIHGQNGKRNTPNIFGLDHWQTFFWDGRASSAQAQALLPIQDPLEMDLSITEALARINANKQYKDMAKEAFNDEQINAAGLAQALVAFQRTIELPKTRFSEFISKVKNSDASAIDFLSDQELKGLHLFRTKAKCMTCHQGALLSDNKFHVTGLHFYGRQSEDLGRYNVTKAPLDVGKFRTASLLLVSQTGPWMHNGLFEQLDGIVNFYNNGGARPRPRKHVKDDPLFPKTSDLLPKLGLSRDEIADLVAFLETL
jgi:cytochrome c peroxidase